MQRADSYGVCTTNELNVKYCIVLYWQKESRDPRFDARSGSLNENLFKKSFSFLDDIKQKERAVRIALFT